MKVISFVATKSSGKSTSLHVLAERLLSDGIPVHIVDCDPQADPFEFVTMASKHFHNLTFTPWTDLYKEDHIPTAVMDIVDSHADKEGVLLIDVQGSDNELLSVGAMVSDLVLVPMVDGNLEHKAINKTLSRLKYLERSIGKELPVRTFWAKAQYIGLTKIAQDIERDAGKIGYSWLGSNLMERREFKHLCLTGKILTEDSKATEQKRQRASIEVADTWVSKIVEVFA